MESQPWLSAWQSHNTAGGYLGQFVPFAQPTVPPQQVIFEALFGMVANKVLGVAVELKIPDHLATDPKDAEELAQAVGADSDALRRMLRTMVGLGFLAQEQDGRFQNNAVSTLLQEDHPDSLRDLVLFLSSDWHWEIWNQMLHAIKTGESGTIAAKGMPFFEYLETNPTGARHFNGAMAGLSRTISPLLASHYDFSKFKKICDVGGGTGTTLAEVLKKNQHLQGILFDQPSVVKEAQENLTSAGVQARCQCISGNFLQCVPAGGDLYIIEGTLQDWNDDKCLQILSNIHQVLPTDGRVLVVEAIMPTHSRFHMTKLLDLQMLTVLNAGRQRTEAEYRALFGHAGFHLNRIIPLPTSTYILELVRAN